MPQQNAVDGSVTIKLGDREFCLSATGRAVRLILEKTGLDLYQNTADVIKPHPSRTNYVIWAMCQNKRNAEPWITIDEVEDLLDLEGLTEAIPAVILALTPKDKREKVGNALKEARAEIQSLTSVSEASVESKSESDTTSSTN